MQLAQKFGVHFYILECTCSDEVVRKRLKKRIRENDYASDGRWELFQKQKNDFDEINEVAADCYFKIDTFANPEIIRQEIIRKIKMGN